MQNSNVKAQRVLYYQNVTQLQTQNIEQADKKSGGNGF